MKNENKCCHGGRWYKLVIILVLMLVVGAVAIVSIIRDRIVNPLQQQVTITGEGKVSYQPDMATILLGVTVNQATTSQAALSDLNKNTDAIIAAVKTAGVDANDISTQGFFISTHYDQANNNSVASGYDATQQLAIKIKDIANKKDFISQVINAATVAGANRVDGITFEVSNLEDLKQQARTKAITAAKAQATVLASTAGVRLKKIVSWYDNIIQAPGANQPYYADGKGGMGGGGTSAGLVPNGLQEIIIDVGVVYQIK